jgi:hypothetical protein
MQYVEIIVRYDAQTVIAYCPEYDEEHSGKLNVVRDLIRHIKYVHNPFEKREVVVYGLGPFPRNYGRIQGFRAAKLPAQRVFIGPRRKWVPFKPASL